MATHRGEHGGNGEEPSEIERRLELLWGVADRPRRGPRPRMSLEAVVAAAVGLADAEGLGAVSMQRVAAELGYTTMSLYRYVPSKEQLVELMADTAVGEPPAWGGDAGWRARMEALTAAMAACYRSRPWLLRVEIAGPPQGPRQLAWFEAYLEALSASGLSGAERVSVVMFVDGAVRELARIAVQIEDARRGGGVGEAAAGAAYAAALRRFAAPERYPNLAALAAEGLFDPAPPERSGSAAGAGPAGECGGPPDGIGADIAFGLRRLLDGVEAYAHERAQARRG